MTTNNELLPCPFCGGTDIFTEPDERGSGGQWCGPIHVGCRSCKAEQCGDDVKFAQTNWNRRLAAMPAGAPAYRLLGAGEIIQANDEFIANDGVTWSAAGTGIWVGMPYTHVLKTARRRIEGES